jgi:hypothetical protein
MLEDKVTTSLKDRLKSFFMATLDAMPEPGADETDPEEQAEAIQYKAIQTLLDQALTSLQTGRESVDALAASDLDDEVEDAHLEALVAMCIQMYGTINGVIKIATSCLQPDSPVGGSVMAYSEHRAAAGARHSAGDRKIIQDAHDNLVTLGADCTSMKAADGNKPCGCKGEDMTTEQRTATIAELTAVTHEGKGFSAEEAKGISMLSDSTLSALKTAAAKSPADMIIQAKAAADAALAGHAHGLNTADAAAQAKKDAKAKADAEEAKMAAAAANTTTTKPRALADFLADPTTPVEVRSLVERQIAAEAEAKAKLVNVLKVAQKEYTEAELTAMSTPELERLTRLTKIEAPVDFSGRGAALPLVGAGAAGATETFTAPDPWAEGLKARSATK